jgi:hypothetical protein
MTCQCCLLQMLCNTSGSSIVFHKKENGYFAEDNSKSLRLAYCPLCGNRDLYENYRIAETGVTELCECDELGNWVKNSSFPISYNKDVSNYYILSSNSDGIIVLRYCPSCGKLIKQIDYSSIERSRTPDFTENEHFCVLKAKLRNVSTVDEVINIMGKPDGISSHSNSYCLQTLIYRKKYKSFYVDVFQFLDKKIDAYAYC